MVEPVQDPLFWKKRIEKCGGQLHRAIFNGSIDQFSPLEQRHRLYLREKIGLGDSVIDCGCGYGRLTDFLPDGYHGFYWGVDISPDLILLGRILHPDYRLSVMDLRDMSAIPSQSLDHAVVCSIKTMVIRNCGQGEWDKMEAEINRVARKVHYLTFGEWD